MKLQPDEISSFQQNGFLGPIRAFSGDEIDRLLAPLDGILDEKEPTHHRHLNVSQVYDLCTNPSIVERIASLLGPDIMLWSSNFFVKQPGARHTPWHQDQNNGGPAGLEPPLNISVWMALDYCLVENSCIKFIAGSHLTTVNHEPPSDGHYFGLADTSSFDLTSAVNMELRKGEFVIFTDRVLHAAEPNTSDKRRAGIAMRFTTPFVKILRPVKGVIVSGKDRFDFNDIVDPPERA